ncbi:MULTISPECIES: ABC transporter ATP-binding protein [unclassified Rhodococcus (in: high G+C Gram-positive bacteria)]|jgi:putative spermidine/putrescine transport system ATP-binding protein|uniref:ABC transporter ATP-binding protein n=1 Tax=unclassified Rhodococcus (in: high G+C Gram-positive bacteria) TaxID=192944 RepID=UPI000BB0F77A|nr:MULTISPECIES: ABC transporter ATP-binding protein [unclassified Rhodococcus (in: high G+C Gram-positive bacteria)]MDI9977331.1 ABC transporter ATP-binding protein [Rhodococcus sp. IEGM 1307]NDV04893.1 ABC transporter ATP-binding protein [Rhodococcus sp. IEGM 248]PBC51277.1 spermidine/putrescine ABC transporter [Rhodococcus sp. ACPA1]
MRSETHSGAGVALDLVGLSKNYGKNGVVKSVDLSIKPGEFVTLLGPSGSGKTTTLSMIAGFTPATAGEILLGGESISSRPPHRRNIGVVFQNYALFPHMTASENIAFPLKRRKMTRAQIKEKVGLALDLVHLREFGDRYPKQLSGGQQQRVALARAVVFDPPILLMDEPLGALDKKLRDSLQGEIRRIHRELGVTIMLVTHDQEEALTLSDRIAVFNEGRIEQCDTGETLYRRPASRFVANFLGESNIFTGPAEDIGNEAVVAIGDSRVRVERTDAPIGVSASFLLRPEVCRVGASNCTNASDGCSLPGVVADLVYLGATRRLEIDVPGHGRITVREPAVTGDQLRRGDDVTISWDFGAATLLPDAQSSAERELATPALT